MQSSFLVVVKLTEVREEWARRPGGLGGGGGGGGGRTGNHGGRKGGRKGRGGGGGKRRVLPQNLREDVGDGGVQVDGVAADSMDRMDGISGSVGGILKGISSDVQRSLVSVDNARKIWGTFNQCQFLQLVMQSSFLVVVKLTEVREEWARRPGGLGGGGGGGGGGGVAEQVTMVGGRVGGRVGVVVEEREGCYQRT